MIARTAGELRRLVEDPAEEHEVLLQEVIPGDPGDDGRVRVLDFGLAKLTQPASKSQPWKHRCSNKWNSSNRPKPP